MLPFSRAQTRTEDTWTAEEYRHRVRFTAALLRYYEHEIGDGFDRYAVIQILSSGFDTHPPPDLPLQVGWFIFNRGATAHGSMYLNWFSHPATRQHDLIDRIERQRRSIEFSRVDGQPTGQLFDASYDLLCQEGQEPITALGQFFGLLQDLSDDGCLLVGHSLYGFTVPLLAAAFNYWFRRNIRWNSHFFDTAMVEKAIQLQFGFPWVEENLATWQHRIHGARFAPGTLYNLPLALRRWGIDARYGLDTRECYNAHFDAQAVHYLFQEMVQIGEMNFGQRPWYQNRGLYAGDSPRSNQPSPGFRA